MDYVKIFLKRAFDIRFFVVLILLMTFILLTWDNNYMLYLKPSFGFLIYSSIIALILFIYGILFTGFKKVKTDPYKGIIILLPVLFIIITGKAGLGSYALSKRTMFVPVTEKKNEKIKTEKKRIIKNIQVKKVKFTDIFRNWSDFDGRKVTVEGLFFNIPENPLIYKYLVNCCVADAIPIGIFVSEEKTKGIEKDQWVRATGTLGRKNVQNHNAVYMDISSIEKISQPRTSDMYVFQ